MTRLLSATLALLLAAAAPGLAKPGHRGPQDHQDPGHPPENHEIREGGLAGVWALTLLSHQVGLELEVEGTTLTGRMLIMGRYVPVSGEGTAETFTLTASEGLRSPITLTGALLPDGSLEGTVPRGEGTETWTGERLPKR
ncbi:MAG: hypothetical protein AB7H88_21890 [Vicinamibacterales bacterium]